MSPVAALMGLLALAYFGSMLVGGRAIRGYGLPSGTEFLILGIFIGPKFLGLLTRSGLSSFEPLILFGLTWLSMTIGLHYGLVGDRRVAARRMFAGLGLALLATVTTGTVALLFTLALTDFGALDAAVLALGCAAVSTETTRHAVRWVTERYGATGSVSELVAEVSEADDLVPIATLAVLFALVPQTDAVALPLPAWALVLATIGAGGIMGATCASLVDIEPRSSQRWGIVLGAMLLTAGTSMRLGLSAITAAFVMGLVAASLMRSRTLVLRMVAPTERAVMVPTLVVAGACVTIPDLPGFTAIALGVLGARVVAKQASARLLTRTQEKAIPRTSLGLGLLPAGVLTMAVGLACALRFPGPVGDTILAVAAIHVVLGEVVGPAMLRRALRLSDEVPASAAATPMPRPRPKPAERPRRGSRGSRGSLAGSRSSDPRGTS